MADARRSFEAYVERTTPVGVDVGLFIIISSTIHSITLQDVVSSDNSDAEGSASSAARGSLGRWIGEGFQEPMAVFPRSGTCTSVPVSVIWQYEDWLNTYTEWLADGASE